MYESSCSTRTLVSTFELNREGTSSFHSLFCVMSGLMSSISVYVFTLAEEIGFLKSIYVIETYYIKDAKFTTENGGTSIRVRGSQEGSLWRTWKRKRTPTTTHGNYNSPLYCVQYSNYKIIQQHQSSFGSLYESSRSTRTLVSTFEINREGTSSFQLCYIIKRGRI
jgi:hypothetical protein